MHVLDVTNTASPSEGQKSSVLVCWTSVHRRPRHNASHVPAVATIKESHLKKSDQSPLHLVLLSLPSLCLSKELFPAHTHHLLFITNAVLI